MTTSSPVQPATEKTIRQSIIEALPNEAVGIIWRQPGMPEIALSLINMSGDPESSYEVDVREIVKALQTGVGDLKNTRQTRQPLSWTDLVLWHSHPSGLVGPSRGDIREKLPDLQYLVVSVVDMRWGRDSVANLIELEWTWF